MRLVLRLLKLNDEPAPGWTRLHLRPATSLHASRRDFPRSERWPASPGAAGEPQPAALGPASSVSKPAELPSC